MNLLRSALSAAMWILAAKCCELAVRLAPRPIRRVLEADRATLVPGIETVYQSADADALAQRRDAQEVWDVLSRRTSWRRTDRRVSA